MIKIKAFFPRISFHPSKRQEFLIVIFILIVLMVTTQIVSLEQRSRMVFILGLVSFLSSLIVLREDLKGIEFLTLTILPTMFTVAVAFFYFLLPVRWLTRVPTVILYGLGMYAILLTENIYNVAAVRSIQLLRAAHSVGFLITLVVVFLLFDTVFSFHFPPVTNSLLIFLISFPLAFQSLWSMTLEQRLSTPLVNGSLTSSLVLGQVAYVLSFWPVNTTIFALFLTTVFYSVVGILQQKLVDRLFERTLKEFLSVVIITFILIIFTARWGG